MITIVILLVLLIIAYFADDNFIGTGYDTYGNHNEALKFYKEPQNINLRYDWHKKNKDGSNSYDLYYADLVTEETNALGSNSDLLRQ